MKLENIDIIIDENMPQDEIHFEYDGKVIGKIVNIAIPTKKEAQ